MYLRTSKRKNKDGSVVEYYHLAHNERHPISGRSIPKIIHNFGRADRLDREELVRLCRSIARVCGLDVRDPLTDDSDESLETGLPKHFQYVSTRELGAPWILEHLWNQLGFKESILGMMKQLKRKTSIERALFAMVANRLCEPESKFGVWDRWLQRVYFPGGEQLKLHHMYDAMDWLYRHAGAIEERVFYQVANLFNLDVDVVFFDTTTASFSVDWEDDDGEDLRQFGHPKEGGWAPQVVVALAVTREGFPVRSWVFPGNTTDVTTIEQVRKDLRGWNLNRTLFVADAGMNSMEAKRELGRACGMYLLATRMNSVKEIREQVLTTRGRYREIQPNLYAKEVIIGDGVKRKRYILCFNEAQAERERKHREYLVNQLEQAFDSHKNHQATAQWAIQLKASKRFGKYLRITKGGLLRMDRAAIKAAEKTDGKWVLETNDDTLKIEDAATTYKALLTIERCFRTLKTTQIRMCPVYHWTSKRIEAHVKICVFALLLERVAEHRTDQTWKQIYEAIRTLQVSEFYRKTFHFFQRNEATNTHKILLQKLETPLPPRVLVKLPKK